jgi:hypothetical protein
MEITLEEVHAEQKRILDILGEVKEQEDGVSRGEIVRAIQRLTEEMKRMNSSVRKHSQYISADSQWKKTHCDRHEDLREEINILSRNYGLVSLAQTFWAPISSVLVRLWQP